MTRSSIPVCLTDHDDIMKVLSSTGRAQVQGWDESRRERFMEIYRSHQALGRSTLGSVLHAWGASAKEDHDHAA